MSESSQQIPGLKQKKVFKIIVLGDSGVGKTCLTYRFCENQFLDKSEATIGVDFRERTVKIDNEEIKLQLWDTAGQERFRKSMVQHYYRNVHAVVIVYDVTKPDTFHSLSSWLQEVEAHGLGGAPRVLVGNKCDAPPALPAHTARRLADQHGMPLFETSAMLDGERGTVDAIFMTLAYKLYAKRPLRVATLQGENSTGVVTLPRGRAPPADRCGCA